MQAFNRLPQEKLLIIAGRDRAGASQASRAEYYLLGPPTVRSRFTLLRRCKAFLFPGLEDFGIAPVEAMSAGRPVIAYAGGGGSDTRDPWRYR